MAEKVTKESAARRAKEAVAELAEEYIEYLPSRPKVYIDYNDNGGKCYYVDFGACEPSEEYIDEVETVQIIVLIDFDNDENWIDVAGRTTHFNYNNGNITPYATSYDERTSTRKMFRRHSLHEGEDYFYGDGLENLKKVENIRVDYALDILTQAIDEGLITDSKSVKVVKEFVQYIKDSETHEGWYAVYDDYEKQYDRCVAFTLIPNNYDSLDSYLKDDDAYVAFCFDYGVNKGDEFYLCLSANSSGIDFYYNNIQLSGRTRGLDKSGKFVVYIDNAESTWKLETLFPSTDSEFTAYESRKARRNARIRESFKETQKLSPNKRKSLEIAKEVVAKLAKPWSKYLPEKAEVEYYDNLYDDASYIVTFKKCKPSEEYDNLEIVDIIVYTNLSAYRDGYIKVGDDEELEFEYNGGDIRGKYRKYPAVKNASNKSPDELEKELADFDSALTMPR